MALKKWVKTAGTALGTQAIVTAANLADRMGSTTKDVVNKKWVEDPNGSGKSMLVDQYSKVEVPGLPFEQAIGPAADLGAKAGLVALGAMGLYHVLGRQWRKNK